MRHCKYYLLFGILIACLPSCKVKKTLVTPSQNTSVKHIDVQGHRGCRGLMPENTIPAFLKAIELGVTTLELDVVISKDDGVIISHEPYFSHTFTTLPTGSSLTKKQEKNHNIYKLTKEEIKKYDVGKIQNPKFKNQKIVAAIKPTLKELVAEVKAFTKSTNSPLPFFNIEIKRHPKNDNRYHPCASRFARLVVDEITTHGIKNKTYIQSFDPETLMEVRKIDPTIPLVLLVGNRKSAKHNLRQLDFTPAVYSPYYKLVSEKLVVLCQARGMQLIPWTVNERKDMEELIELGVDGIISDYPDVLIEVTEEMEGYEVK